MLKKLIKFCLTERIDDKKYTLLTPMYTLHIIVNIQKKKLKLSKIVKNKE